MANLIKYNFLLFAKDKKKIFVLMFFSLFCGINVSMAIPTNLTGWEYILYILSNYYYIVYFMFLSFVFFCVENIKKESDLVSIRMQSIRRQYICRVISGFLQASFYVCMHLVVVVFIALPLFSWENQFAAVELDGLYDEMLGIIINYGRFFSTPCGAVVTLVAYLIVGLSFASVMIYTVLKMTTKKLTMCWLGVLIVGAAVGARFPVKGIFEILFSNNYFVLHHVLFRNGVKYMVVNLILVACACVGNYYILKNGGKLWTRLLNSKR